MNILGIIAEYNPFHNGHRHHIEQSAAMSNSDAVIAVLGSNFTQRGDLAFMEKHIRAQTAVLNGVDLAIELPVVYSSASAEYFAFGGVSALVSTGLVTHIGFGCENAEIDKMNIIANELINESAEFVSFLKQTMSTGISYAKARIKALENVLGFPVDFISKPNNILAVEYLKALKLLNSSILPCPVKRKGSGYNYEKLDNINASSSALRKFIYEKMNCSDSPAAPDELLSQIEPFVPQSVYDIIKEQMLSGNIPDNTKLDIHVLTLLRTLGTENIANLPYVSEGLENRLIQAAEKSININEFYTLCNSSRYPNSRISRIIASLLTGVTASILDISKTNGFPYLKVLAFNNKGADLLKQMKKTASVPVITKPSDLKKLSGFAAAVADVDARATDFYNLCLYNPKCSGMEYKATPYLNLYS